ncbi:MAG: EscU/YscU/HrcU family type III secretion system export apparatus switch protein [Planctomycetota bacterium]|nr:EscU/YscU/HrcU family type III secretion system export apparatus switch protein [Planctomycetota bacterium]MDA1177377.1 EscU/YscU/HrcU family type III secretion system export apparatus switch protein [Planctomycetota bacterium]
MMWFSSPTFRAATTWLGLLLLIRWYGTFGMQRATQIVQNWIGGSLPPEQLVPALQELTLQVLQTLGIPLLLLACGVVCLQHVWQARWSRTIDRQSEAMAIAPGKMARLTLATVQWCGSLLAFGICTWWAAYAVLPLVLLSPSDDATTVTLATGIAAWRLGLSLGVTLLAVAFVDVSIRARFTRPDEEAQFQLERQMRRETEGSPELRRKRRQTHRDLIG